MGPDGKVYYFPRYADGTTALVASGRPSRTCREGGLHHGDLRGRPCRGRRLHQRRPHGRRGRHLLHGAGIRYTWTADDPAVVEVVEQLSDEDPVAKIRFVSAGNYTLKLIAENDAGSDVSEMPICVLAVPRSAPGR